MKQLSSSQPSDWFTVALAVLLNLNTTWGDAPRPLQTAVDGTSFLLTADGRLFSWGRSGDGELGRGPRLDQVFAGEVAVPPGAGAWRDVSLGWNENFARTAWAIADTGGLYTWGADCQYPLSPRETRPLAVNSNGGHSWTTGVAGMTFGEDRELYAWQNDGNCGFANRHPVLLTHPIGSAQWLSISRGGGHTLILDENGGLFPMGLNFAGVYGDGTTTDAIGLSTKTLFPPEVSRWERAVAGWLMSLALGSDGRLYSWGRNNDGRLGRKSPDPARTPGAIDFPAGVTKWLDFAAVRAGTIALGDDGEIYEWGPLIEGGGSPGNPRIVPRPAGITHWQSVGGGVGHGLAVGDDGRVYSWGQNESGQLGRITGYYDPVPGLVEGVEPFLSGRVPALDVVSVATSKPLLSRPAFPSDPPSPGLVTLTRTGPTDQEVVVSLRLLGPTNQFGFVGLTFSNIVVPVLQPRTAIVVFPRGGSQYTFAVLPLFDRSLIKEVTLTVELPPQALINLGDASQVDITIEPQRVPSDWVTLRPVGHPVPTSKGAELIVEASVAESLVIEGSTDLRLWTSIAGQRVSGSGYWSVPVEPSLAQQFLRARRAP